MASSISFVDGGIMSSVAALAMISNKTVRLSKLYLVSTITGLSTHYFLLLMVHSRREDGGINHNISWCVNHSSMVILNHANSWCGDLYSSQLIHLNERRRLNLPKIISNYFPKIKQKNFRSSSSPPKCNLLTKAETGPDLSLLTPTNCRARRTIYNGM